MKKQRNVIYLSASDLVGHLNCRHMTALDLLYLAWATEATLLRRYEQTKALAAEAGELAVESIVDAILESQLREVEEARALYRRCESADRDGTGIMSIDASLAATRDQG